MSNYQKRHYEELAAVIQRADRFCETDNQRRGVERVRNELIELLRFDNGMFNRQRFEAACIPGANVRARS